MRWVDHLLTGVLRGPLTALIDERVAQQVEQLKLDALYAYRWHGDRRRLHIPRRRSSTTRCSTSPEVRSHWASTPSSGTTSPF